MYDSSLEEKFLVQKFREYYSKNVISSVVEVEKREFGYGVFKRKIANRNLSFNSESSMNSFLREKTPLFFSYSNSYYSFPNMTPMTEKGWLRADIIYEFDADEIKNDCKNIDGVWRCEKVFGEGSLVEETTVDKETKQWFLLKSLERAKKHVFRLVDIIDSDFGFPKEKVNINFSGKAGYHVHLRDETIQSLNKRARIELVDYLTCFGVSYPSLGYDFEKELVCAQKGNLVKRINLALKDFFEKDSGEIALITGLNKTKINQFLKDKESILHSIDNGFLYSVGARTNKDFWQKVFDFVLQTITVPIDRQTSVDLHKIIRVPNTLHGETGFIAKELSLNDLETFNPFNDAIVFDNTLTKIFVSKAPEFILKENKFGPFEQETVEVPLYCAVYLIGKGVAKIIA